MTRLMKLVILVGLALATAGCGDDGGGDANAAAANLCARLAGPQCNLVGGGVEGCTQQVQLCVRGLTENVASDWADAVNSCLEQATCDFVSNCYQSVPFC